jgi:hypothetical protein
MEKPAAPPNRNVVARRVAVHPRVEARTTEFDCRRIAELLDAQAAAPKPVDLEADIEIATSSSEPSTVRGPSRLAHTMRRPGAELARGSQPIAIAPEPEPIVEVKPAAPTSATATTPMPVLMAEILVHDSTLVPDLTPQTPPTTLDTSGSSGIWWIVAIVAVVVSGLALLGALVYL